MRTNLKTSDLQRDIRVFIVCVRIPGFKNLTVLEHGYLENHLSEEKVANMRRSQKVTIYSVKN